jgi:hypothetical protein
VVTAHPTTGQSILDIHSPLEASPRASVQFNRKTVQRWALILLVSAIPALFMAGLVAGYFQKNLYDFVPYANDEVNYWHETKTFIEVGFEGGYYTLNEREPSASFTHFYTHGPWYPLIYGAVGIVFGWERYSAPFINVVMIAVALMIFCVTARLNNWQLMVTGLVALTFWPMAQYLISNMQESTQYFTAIVGAALFYIVIKQQQALSLRLRLLFVVFLFVATVIRTSWAILLLPFFYFTAHKSMVGVVAAVVKSLVVALLALFISSYVGAPGNNSILTVVNAFFVSFTAGMDALVGQTGSNLTKFVKIIQEDSLYPLVVIQMVGTIVLLIIGGVNYVRRKESDQAQSTTGLEIGFHLFNLVVVVVACLGLYLANGYVRIFSLHLMLTLLLLIAFQRWRLAAFIIALSILWFPAYLPTYGESATAHFPPNHGRIDYFQTRAEAAIPYDPTLDNAWCNTLLFHSSSYVGELTGVPAGIGLSFFLRADDPILKFKSRYLFLNDEQARNVTTLPDAPRLEPISSTTLGTFYLNLDADCPPPPLK